MRFLLIANDFPNAYEPTKGVFNLYLARALAQHHEVRVISPVSWVASLRGKASAGPLPHRDPVLLDGVQVYYPCYFYPPKFGRTRYGWFLWQSIRATVWRLLDSYLPDAVIGYWAHPDGEVAVRVARLLGVPSAVIVGGSDVLLLPRDHKRRRCVVKVLNETDAVLARSWRLAVTSNRKPYNWASHRTRFTSGRRGWIRMSLHRGIVPTRGAVSVSQSRGRRSCG
jgi:hypothetical protein